MFVQFLLFIWPTKLFNYLLAYKNLDTCTANNNYRFDKFVLTTWRVCKFFINTLSSEFEKKTERHEQRPKKKRYEKTKENVYGSVWMRTTYMHVTTNFAFFPLFIVVVKNLYVMIYKYMRSLCKI